MYHFNTSDQREVLCYKSYVSLCTRAPSQCCPLHQGNIMMLPWRVVYLFFDLKQLLFDLKVPTLIYGWLFLHCFYKEACKVVPYNWKCSRYVIFTDFTVERATVKISFMKIYHQACLVCKHVCEIWKFQWQDAPSVKILI